MSAIASFRADRKEPPCKTDLLMRNTSEKLRHNWLVHIYFIDNICRFLFDTLIIVTTHRFHYRIRTSGSDAIYIYVF